ncbi:MAG TPA: aminoglycoside phosphotransferase family protein [Gemmataceae bacterium]|nr:aminoglycoside phosphotransferase family protein [Gemmataceae bacterium]
MTELTPDNVLDYLRRSGRIGPGPARVTPLGWGVSNAVFRVETADGPFVLKQSRPQLRTRDLWLSDLDRVYREQEVMELLYPLLPEPTVPAVLFADRPNYVFAMSHAPLESRVWKESLLAGEVDLSLGERAGRVLGIMHERTAHGGAVEAFRDHTAFVQLRVDPFYRRVQERRPEVAGAVAPLIEQLLSVKEALCHGDYSPKNILTHSQGFTLVDYETAHLGDPTMDLGFVLSHLILKALKRHEERDRFFDLTRAVWRGYGAEVRFRPVSELEARGISHFAVCLLARIDGTSPVDYLPEEPKREAARRLGRRVLLDRVAAWEDVLSIAEAEFRSMSL